MYSLATFLVFTGSELLDSIALFSISITGEYLLGLIGVRYFILKNIAIMAKYKITVITIETISREVRHSACNHLVLDTKLPSL